MTSSSQSPDPAGFARHDSQRIPLAGPFVSEMPAPRGGVFLTDMPQGRPQQPARKRIKGVPGASNAAGDDYQPGQGTWSDAT